MSATLTLIEKTVFMKSLDVFEAIPTEALAQVAALAVERSFDRGDVVWRVGEGDYDVLLVVEGAIELRKGGTVVRLLERGTVQGQLFLEEAEAGEYSAVAVQDTQALSLQRRDVLQALLDFPECALAVVQDLARRHHQVVARVIELEGQLASGNATPSPVASPAPAAIEPAAPPPTLPRRRGWWRFAARPQGRE